ncbi:hypothetical protein NQ487_19715 [Hungatella hathewayi]|uniref:hypothetical protein n=1 Tax=Hungatella hathewayi TaxID=154046 RepID=UPI0001C365F2|nr:hypothetical protein [Hungatella hathewayi]UWO83097.1 hypothetical protein NQ487_19715 [Hungatella hathewayi]
MLLEQPKEIVKVSKNMKFGDLTTQWCYGLAPDRVWKCTCGCGSVCYVKEAALQQNIVENCGNAIHKKKTSSIQPAKRKYIVCGGIERHVCLLCNADMPYDSRKVYCEKCRQLKKLK